MDDRPQKKLLRSLFWIVLPFAITCCFIILVLRYKTDDPTYWFIFLPAVILCVFPFSIVVSYFLRMRIKAKLLKIPSGAELINPEIRQLSTKAAKWGMIAILTWICVFLIISGIAITSIKKERSQSQVVRIERSDALSKGSPKYAILHTLDMAIICLLPMSLVALIIFAIYLARTLFRNRAKINKETRIFYKFIPFICFFVAPILFILLLSSLMTWLIRGEVKGFLGDLSSDMVIMINDKPVKNPGLIIAELSKVASLPAHHTRYTKKFRVEVVSHDRSLTIELGRDSNNTQEYWLFYPGYHYTSNNEFGRIITTTFNDY
jgi:hypothetical protein